MAGLAVGPFPRRDLVQEFFGSFDGSGEYFTDYIDSSDMRNVRIAFWTNSSTSPSTCIVEENQWDSASTNLHLIRTQSVTIGSAPGGGYEGYAELPLTGRYFQIIISGADANAPLAMTLRAV